MSKPYFSVDQHGNFEIKSTPAFFQVGEDPYGDFEEGAVLPCFVLNYFSQPFGDEALLYIPACSKDGHHCGAGFIMAHVGEPVAKEHTSFYAYYFVDANQSWCNVPKSFKRV